MTKEHLAPDIVELLALFHRHGARVILVGGEAVTYHGYARFTGAVDLVYDRCPSGAARVYSALAEFWGGRVPAVASAADLEQPDLVVQFGRVPHRIDLLSDLPGVDFEEAWATRVQDAIHLPSGDVPLAILSLNLLLRNKASVGRAKDLDDVEHLTEQRRLAAGSVGED